VQEGQTDDLLDPFPVLTIGVGQCKGNIMTQDFYTTVVSGPWLESWVKVKTERGYLLAFYYKQ
jgi:hypothetical protein